MKKVLLLTTIGVICFLSVTHSQNVFNPADKNRRWINNGAVYSNDSLLNVANPDPNILGLQKWVSVKTSGIDSNSWGKDYKAYYMNLNGIQLAFRLKYPKSYSNPDSAGKKYPIMLFFHGAGEPGCPSNGGVYNNEKQLVHGGRRFRDAVESNAFDGFLLYPQKVVGANCFSDWGIAGFAISYNAVIGILDSMGKYTRADVDRVFVDGLSNGGVASWSFTAAFPQRVAKAAPSAAATQHTNYTDFVHVPIWFASGGLDTNPSPSYAQSTYDGLKNIGADIRWTLYPTLGHFVWDTHWSDAGFLPYMNDMHKANPLVYFQRYDYCPDSAINARLGITAGFYAYEWQRNGATIATRINGVNTVIDGSSIIQFTGNEVRVNAFGTYRVRFKRSATSDWTIYSPKPAVIYQKASTPTPAITVTGTRSKVLPALDATTSVPLALPAGYSGYQWVRVSDNVIVSTTNTYTAPIGQYKAKVLEQFGCGSIFSPIFTVIDAAGNPKPDGAKNLVAFASSVNGIQLDWNENPNAGENETGFEVYRSTVSGGPYQLLTITAPNVVSYLDQNITGNTQYYYIVRAVGQFGAAPNSNEAEVSALQDNISPSIPTGLTVTCASRTNVSLKWNASTDNLGVERYDIYVNGVKSYSTANTFFAINELASLQTFAFTVLARDAAGNLSAPSNQATASTTLQGVCYKFFQNAAGLVELPDYNNLTPAATGIAPNIAFTAGGTDNFGYLWEGYVNITTAGNYRFQTCSDDGSKLYFNGTYNYVAAPTVDNDGAHGTTCVTSATVALGVGVYPIAAVFFEAGGGEAMTVNWARQISGNYNYAAIPNSWFQESVPYVPPGGAPAAPTNVTATAAAYNKINLTWRDNSANESGFEIVRSTSATGTFAQIATVNGSAYTDSGLNANTRYYYKVRSVGAYGQSSYSSSEAKWNFNGSSSIDKLGTAARDIVGNGTAFTLADKVEGDASLVFDNTDYGGLAGSEPDGGFPSDGGYNQRTVSLWVRFNGAITNTRKMLFEFGGSDHGMALRTNSTSGADEADLQARVVIGGTGQTLTVSNFQSNVNYLATWNHIVVVYNSPGLSIYLNGVLVGSLSNLPTGSVGTPTSSSRIGSPSSTGTGHAFNDAVTYTSFNGWLDDMQVLNEASNASDVAILRTFGHGESMDTTFAADPIPAVPTNLVAQVASKDNINLTWNDNSTNETSFEVWRSVGNQANFRLIKTIPGGPGATKNYSDTALFANITYYYVVKAVGLGGTSANSNTVSAKTLNTPPAFTNILDFTMKYNTVFSLPVNAIDEDGDALVFTFENLPYFSNIEAVSNGNINVVLNPGFGDEGAYTVIAYVDDGNNGKDTTFFTMVVNDNTVPVLNNVTDRTIAEGATLVIPLTANDAEGNANMVWTFENKPSFVTFTDNGNGSGSLTVQPGYSASGVYNMTVYADDGNGAWASRTFKITVTELDPNESIRVNFKTFSGNVPTWNDIDLYAAAPFNRGALVTAKGAITPIGIQALNTGYGGAAAGVQTGNNSGVFPDAVLKDYMEWGTFNFGSADTMRLRVYGLDPARRYNFVFFGSTTVNCCGHNANSVTTYRIDNQVAQVRFYLNSTETDTIYQIQPNGAGQINITMIGDAATSQGGVLNALVIDAAFDDGTTPAKPLNLDANFAENAGVRLTWVDRSYNETSYKIYRATTKAGPYTLLNPGSSNKDSVAYTDGTANQFTSYWYYVAGNNNYGDGASSDTVNILTENNKPVITNLNDFRVKTGATFNEDFNVSDYVTDVVSVSILKKPSFLTLTPMGGTSYRITATPTIDNLGQHFLTVLAKDDKGGETTKDFIITVADANTRSVFVNLGDYTKVAPAPWNNFLHYGNAGQVYNNLLDENGTPSLFNIQLVEAWTSMFLTGHKTGNNSGAVPDTVLSGGIFYNQANNRAITITGLQGGTKRYNIVVVGSQNEGYDAVMRITTSVGGADTINAKYNTNLTANLNNLTAAGGAITLNMNRLSGNAIYLNAIIIEEFESSITLMNPVNLYVEPKDATTTVLSWSDRSSNESVGDGFQLSRATDSLFTANVTTIDLPGNTTAYTNTGLAANTKYFYRVRAKTGVSTFSAWSNLVKTITPQSIVLVNFNQNVQSAGTPWNNLEAFPNPGVTYANLKNQNNANSGITLTITKTFNGENNAGMSTNNNTGMGGLVPDIVMQSGYWIDNQQQAQITLSGLNQNKRYRVGYISSSNWIGGNLTATFTVNGRTVYINSWQNTSKIVYIGDLQANSDGELILDISSTAASANAYSSGLIIQSYDDVNGGAVLNAPNPNGLERNIVMEGAGENLLVTPQGIQVPISVYPNPFSDYVNVDFSNTSAGNNIALDIYDVSGRMVMKRNFGKLPVGANTLRLSGAEAKLNTGVYFIALNVNGQVVSVNKLVKTKQ
ncbi:MAG: fibronectin type III domain-containing protein [Chitinophagaceae bacterium]|nr:fibronectin type III domain-containing protein [Chitinophagaceae bacterium]